MYGMWVRLLLRITKQSGCLVTNTIAFAVTLRITILVESFLMRLRSLIGKAHGLTNLWVVGSIPIVNDLWGGGVDGDTLKLKSAIRTI